MIEQKGKKGKRKGKERKRDRVDDQSELVL
jgi:hypothetical protein